MQNKITSSSKLPNMWKLMKYFKKAKSTTQDNAEEIHKQNSNSQIIERYQIEGSPFWELKTQEGWFLAVGEHRVTELHAQRFNVQKYIKENMWQLITTLILVVTTKEKERTAVKDK